MDDDLWLSTKDAALKSRSTKLPFIFQKLCSHAALVANFFTTKTEIDVPKFRMDCLKSSPNKVCLLYGASVMKYLHCLVTTMILHYVANYFLHEDVHILKFLVDEPQYHVI